MNVECFQDYTTKIKIKLSCVLANKDGMSILK